MIRVKSFKPIKVKPSTIPQIETVNPSLPITSNGRSGQHAKANPGKLT